MILWFGSFHIMLLLIWLIFLLLLLLIALLILSLHFKIVIFQINKFITNFRKLNFISKTFLNYKSNYFIYFSILKLKFYFCSYLIAKISVGNI